MAQPTEYQAEEQAPHLGAAYAYIIQHDDGTQQYWTSFDEEFIITNLPVGIVPTGTATFLPAQIKHGSIQSSDRFESRRVSVSIDSQDTSLQRFFVTAAAVKLKGWILRIAMLEIAGSLDYTRHAYLVASGILSRFAFSGQTIQADLTPEPFYVDHSVPRYFMQATCNHALYGAGCGLVKASFSFATTIIAIDISARTVTVAGQRPASAANYFEAGHFFHNQTALNFAIGWSEFAGPNTRFKLSYWHPDINVGDGLTAFAGCRHTVADCTAKFANAANFGGFPFIPSRNPVTAGLA